MKKYGYVKLLFYLLVFIICGAVGDVKIFCAANDTFDFLAKVDDPLNNDFLDNVEMNVQKTIDPASIINLLMSLKAFCLLENNLYVNTYPLNKKSIIDVPAFFTYRDYNRKKTFGMGFFFNQTSRMFFSQDCDGIKSYMAVCQPTLLQRLSDCATCIRHVFPSYALEPMVIFPLFANVTVQERQVGMMVHGDKKFKKWYLHVHVPVLYQERNYYMTTAERTCIEKAFASITTQCGTDDSQEQPASCAAQSCADDSDHVGMGADKSNPVDMAFVQQHLIGDSLGIGDTRLHLDLELVKRHYYNLAVGFVATVPTAFAFKKGVFGSNYQDGCVPKDFDIGQIFDLQQAGEIAQAQNLGKTFALGALDQMSANLLDSGLGYGKHLGLGVSYRTMGRLSFLIKRPWAHAIKMRSRMILQYYTPGTEMRAFVENKNPDDYGPEAIDLDKVNEDESYAREKLNFINTKLIQEFYPFRLRTVVRPGFIFQSTTGYYYESRHWRVQLVSDFWAKMAESFGTICIPEGMPPLAISCAKRPSAMQSRIGVLLAYTAVRPTYVWTFSLYGDTTYWSKGIGKDFNIVFNAECNF